MELITRHLCKTSNLGVHGNLFGGKMLWWKNVFYHIFILKSINYGNLYDNQFNNKKVLYW